ncbi:hypothetical protein BH11ARM2_BH11ARM2_11100 [soil metagenome]
MAAPGSLAKLVEFLQELEARQLHYTIEHHSEDAVMIDVAVEDERWEFEFFIDGTVEVEVFKTQGIEGEEAVTRFFEENPVEIEEEES